MTCKVAARQVDKQSVAMEHANGIWVKAEPLRKALKGSTVQTWQKIIQDVWNYMSGQMWGGLLFLNLWDIHFGLWSALFLRLLGLLTLLVNMFRATNLHRRVLVRVKGWYVERRGAQSWFQRCVDWFGLWMRPSSGAHTKRGVKCVSVHVSGDAPRADACTLIRSGARWWGLRRADELKFMLAHHLTLQPLQYASYFSAVPLLVLPFSLFFIIVWCCPFQQRPTGSHSLPNYLHIKRGSPQRRRP